MAHLEKVGVAPPCKVLLVKNENLGAKKRTSNMSKIYKCKCSLFLLISFISFD